MRNYVGGVADQDHGGGSFRGRVVGATCGGICGCVMVRPMVLVGRGVKQRIRLSSPSGRISLETL